MKKILFAIAFVTMMAANANAQIDGFSGDINAPVPVGSGLLVLTALGAGYAVAKKKKKSF